MYWHHSPATDTLDNHYLFSVSIDFSILVIYIYKSLRDGLTIRLFNCSTVLPVATIRTDHQGQTLQPVG